MVVAEASEDIENGAIRLDDVIAERHRRNSGEDSSAGARWFQNHVNAKTNMRGPIFRSPRAPAWNWLAVVLVGGVVSLLA